MRDILATDSNIRLAVVVDLDGVLADNSHCLHLIQCDEPDWHAFNAALDDAALIEGWATLVSMLHDQGYTIIIMTNRSEHLVMRAEAWLARHEIRYDYLSMRDPFEQANSSKDRRLREFQQEHIIMLAIDDDPTHIEMYKSHGIPALYAHSGYYDHGFVSGIESADVISSLETATT